MNNTRYWKWAAREVATSSSMQEMYSLAGIISVACALIGGSAMPLAGGLGFVAIVLSLFVLIFGCSAYGRNSYQNKHYANM